MSIIKINHFQCLLSKCACHILSGDSLSSFVIDYRDEDLGSYFNGIEYGDDKSSEFRLCVLFFLLDKKKKTMNSVYLASTRSARVFLFNVVFVLKMNFVLELLCYRYRYFAKTLYHLFKMFNVAAFLWPLLVFQCVSVNAPHLVGKS